MLDLWVIGRVRVNLSALKKLVKHGEGSMLEFKRSTGELAEGLASLCGMLNGAGKGTVLFGVSDKGELVGQCVVDKTKREIANASRRIEPPCDVEVQQVTVKDGLSVVVVEARAQEPGPYSFEGRAYLRVSSTTQRMSRPEFDRRVADRLLGQMPWDRWVAPEWRITDLDAEEIQRSLSDAVDASRLSGMAGDKLDVVLRRLELVRDGQVTRAAAIVFGQEDGPGFPMGELRLARFKGTTKDEFRDNRQYKAHAFALLRQAERFLDDHVQVASHFVEGRMQRMDVPQYPPLAVREALVNAFVHRDYAIDGGAVSVAIFDDRLEIWSTGTLPGGLTPAMLKGVHESVPRNRLIAEVFHRRGLIERWGRGTNKILAEAKRVGCPEPEFEEHAGAFVVRFLPSRALVRERSPAVSKESLHVARQGQIIEMIRASGSVTNREVRTALEVSDETVRKILAAMVKQGLIVPFGKGRSLKYRLP